MRTLFIASAFFATMIGRGQYPGELDLSFLPGDAGFAKGDGTDNSLRCSALRPDGRVLIGGLFNGLNQASGHRLASLNPDGTLDATFVPTQLPSSVSPSGVNSMALQPDGKVVVGGPFNRGVHRMKVTGVVDSSFISGPGFLGSPSAEVYVVALQPDGKVLVGGRFTSFNGTAVTNLARLNANGTLDLTFQTNNGLNGDVNDLVVQPDGRIIVVGTFTTCYGAHGRLVRLLADGSLDLSFTASPGADNTINDVLLRADGTMLIAGTFGSVNGTYAPYLCRLSANGLVDPGFVVLPGTVNYSIRRLVEQADQRLLVAFSNSMIRLQVNGATDSTFAPPVLTYQPAFSRNISTVFELSDGRIFIGGSFCSVNGWSANHFALLHANGTIDTSFNTPYVFNNITHAVTRLPDGRLVVSGTFNGFNGIPTNAWTTNSAHSIVRLLPDGSLDPSFTPFASSSLRPSQAVQPDGKVITAGFYINRVNADGTSDTGFPNGAIGNNTAATDLKIDADGKLLMCGAFQAFGGQTSRGIVRLNTNGTVDGTLVTGTGFANYTTASHMALQPDGRIVVVGMFTEYNGIPVNRICRLMPNGALDTSFHIGSGFDGFMYDAEVLPDGRILVAGIASNYNGQQVGPLTMLHQDGTLDTSFDTEVGPYWGSGYTVLTYDPIGKLLVAPPYGPDRLLRLNMDGSIDPTFDMGTGFSSTVTEVLVLPDTSYLVTGGFTRYNGIGRNRIAKINGGRSSKTTVQVNCFLGGPYLSFPMMSASLSGQGLLPQVEPYSGLGYPHVGGGGESASTGYPLQITDWVVVELRDAADPSVVVATQSALLRKDGRALSTRFLRTLVFAVPQGNYYVAVHHRNHLGVMTATAIPLNDMPTLVDFTDPATATYGTSAQRVAVNRMVLWEGDANGDRKLKYTGTQNDRDVILTAIGGSNPVNTVTGYRSEDVNLDGVVKYTGFGNDRDPIIANMPGQLPTAMRIEQVP